MTKGREWEFWIDVGGTFTDCIARRPDGSVATHKLLSSAVYKGAVVHGSTAQCIRDPLRTGDPAGFFQGFQLTQLAPSAGAGHPAGNRVLDTVPVSHYDHAIGELHLERPLGVEPVPGQAYELRSHEEAPVTGVRWLMGLRLDEDIGPVSLKIGTTRATNALLERQGAPTALVTTAGFGDVLRIAYQNRPRLFDLNIRKAGDLYREVVEIEERLDKDGDVLRPLDIARAHHALQGAQARGIQSLAICLMHAFRNGAHEELLADIARQLGFEHVSLSSRLSPLPKIVARGDTTALDAYLTPVLRSYCRRIAAQAPQATIQFMTSAGGLVSGSRFTGRDAILSGPAGGVVGAAYVAREAGFSKVIGFDMGGTSTDVSRFDGEYERRYEMELTNPRDGSAVRLVAPMLAVETVAAGGGSICWFDGQKPVVGPRSAGSEPGPACYGRGGPLCVTDVNLFLGKMLPDEFPFPLDRAAVAARLDELIEQIAAATGRRYTRETLAAGFTAIANANMVAPIRQISLARGYDVRDYTLVSFGGAGAQHACAIARELGIQRVLCSPYAGALSALGIGVADVTKLAERAVGRLYAEVADAGGEPVLLEPVFEAMEQELRQQILAEGVAAASILPPRRRLDMRYQGQEARLAVPCPPEGDYRREFERLHRQLYGFVFAERPIEVYAARVELVGEAARPPVARRGPHVRQPAPGRSTQAYFAGAYHTTGVFDRDDLRPGDRISGPAIVVEAMSTAVIEPGWRGEITAENDLLLSTVEQSRSPAEAPTGDTMPGTGAAPDPIALELFNNRFASIAAQMGATLQKTALSTNVKERLDFSCAVFSGSGDLVVNAPHIPVHLGAMSECVKCLIEDIGAMQPGDVYVTNDPFRGGSHLPDVTVITPVFAPASTAQPRPDNPPSCEPQFFVASRAHHAEIGGITPGSMPPFSTSLAEEGVLIRHFQLVTQGQTREAELAQLLGSGPYPSRAVADNIADIRAQTAANRSGAQLLVEMTAEHGAATVLSYMGHIQRAAENKMRAALRRIPAGEYAFADTLDDGSPVCVTITVRHVERDGVVGGEACLDFAGTGPVLPGNLNANRAIVTSAVLYCFRCLIDEEIPLNSGVLAPLEIRLPNHCLLNPPVDNDPAHCAAVVGGNVETSQRIVDVIFGALGIVAASQGTMNNLLFGRSGAQAFGYYETVGGGAGAGPGFDGADAVHTHMTNTRLTDPEVLELRYPVRLRRCAIRQGSGGAGRSRGGCGMIREIEFLAALQVSLLMSRRTTRPYGMHGGESGLPGRNWLQRRGDPDFVPVPGTAGLQVEAGDILRIETPGGGGCGILSRGNQPNNPG